MHAALTGAFILQIQNLMKPTDILYLSFLQFEMPIN